MKFILQSEEIKTSVLQYLDSLNIPIQSEIDITILDEDGLEMVVEPIKKQTENTNQRAQMNETKNESEEKSEPLFG